MKFVATALLTVFFGLCAGASHAQEFSADVVYSPPKSAASKPGQDVASPPQPSKLFVGKNQMRLENHGVSGTVLLVDWDTQTTTLLFPQHKAYQYLPNHPSQYFRVRDAENACPDWQMASAVKIVCEKVAPEDVAGRSAVKYRNKSVTGDASLTAVWIDPTLNFVIKWESVETTAEVRNIIAGQQAGALFVLPASYEALKPTKKPPKGGGPTPPR